VKNKSREPLVLQPRPTNFGAISIHFVHIFPTYFPHTFAAVRCEHAVPQKIASAYEKSGSLRYRILPRQRRRNVRDLRRDLPAMRWDYG
jgi:hypothetical protein